MCARGKKTLVGLCPFHKEIRPSFCVYPDTNSWICRSTGCGKSGGPIKFIMQVEGKSYQEAVLHLAKRFGIEVKYDMK